jgi:Zn-dependent protease with chaperone function
MHRPTADREAVIHRYGTLRFYHQFLLIGCYAIALYLLGWGWAVQELCGLAVNTRHATPELLPGSELLLLAPFLVGLVLSWACFYDADRAIHEESAEMFWTRRSYVLFRIRQNLALLFAPLALMVGVKGLEHYCGGDYAGEWVMAVTALLVACVFIAFPWVLRLVLGLKPLPNGPLRDRLMAAAARLNFSFSNVLIWNTHGGVANAIVAGVLPRPRYVLLTDRLAQDLSHEEVEAVFGHEIGHIKHQHIPYYVGFMLISMAVVGCLWSLATQKIPWLRELFPPTDDWTKVPFVALVGAYIFLVFGFVSRRCERQADVYGCRAVSCARPACQGHQKELSLPQGAEGLCATGIRTFIDALEKVDRINNGPSRNRHGWLQSWQHSTVAHRVEFLRRLMADPSQERQFQRRVGLVKWGLALGLGLVFAVMVGIRGWENLF